MEEELSDHELEEQLHSVQHTRSVPQPNIDLEPKKFVFDSAKYPKSTVRRYWHANVDEPSPYRKTNPTYNILNNEKQTKAQNPSQDLNQKKNKHPESTTEQATKNENQARHVKSNNLSLLLSPIPSNLKKTIEILDHNDSRVVNIESSDEDEVIEVVLPPKPTITIESSDDEVSPLPDVPPINGNSKTTENKIANERSVSSSPVPSIVSSVSDEFIRGDCIALNISSKHQNNQSFDFSLHGSDLLVQPTKKKKKKNKELTASSTPLKNTETSKTNTEPCFATPKSKAKKKKSKQVRCAPFEDVYDSDSNQSIIDTNKAPNYAVTDKSLPSTDVYESDSNQSEQTKEKKDNEVSSEESTLILENTVPPAEDFISLVSHSDSIDLTSDMAIDENIVMANVTGFTDDVTVESFSDGNHSKLGSTNIPKILSEDLDFDNLKGYSQFCTRRRYSITTLRAEMEKFYNESWGGENFNHKEIQKSMSRDKSLWVIDPKDKMPSSRRKTTCNYCNRPGHRDDTCHFKPAVCYMCGSTGHYEPRCPRKICVNCGSPNHIYSNVCRNCANWRYIKCVECGQGGHPASHCPDLWRRYHDTTDFKNLEESRQLKKHNQQFCSGCTRRGHLVHSCRTSVPFSALPINSPYVISYAPLYPCIHNENANPNTQQDTTISSHTQKTPTNKRQSKSPTVHETHQPKRRNILSESKDERFNKSPHNKNAQNPITTENSDPKPTSDTAVEDQSTSNVDNKGHMIQDNEVSDTSELIFSARIYLTKEIRQALNSEDGKMWLNNAKEKNHIILEDVNLQKEFLDIKGSMGNQEAFQSELREWTKGKQINDAPSNIKNSNTDNLNDIPKKKTVLLRKLNSSMDSLKKFLGEPNILYKELMFHQNRRGELLKQKELSNVKLGNNRDNIRGMLKKLNMVLLGQAGLADGLHHLHQLNMLKNQIAQSKNITVSETLRNEIGKHFHCIFSALPRDDYAELVQKYNCIKNSASPFKKKKKGPFTVRTKPGTSVTQVNPKRNEVYLEISDSKKSLSNRFFKRITLLHRRLMNSQPADPGALKAHKELDTKLRNGIATLQKLDCMSPKTKRKMEKLQNQAQCFLSSV
ncbi:unnamed protein product [Leptosia nina]|uniref:Zinc finger CCHC domain-containing protein 7 n=1 Tax=Leptosia nina TaxID=320188 RepID=A0AAV1IWZ6_9NEOP